MAVVTDNARNIINAVNTLTNLSVEGQLIFGSL